MFAAEYDSMRNYTQLLACERRRCTIRILLATVKCGCSSKMKETPQSHTPEFRLAGYSHSACFGVPASLHHVLDHIEKGLAKVHPVSINEKPSYSKPSLFFLPMGITNFVWRSLYILACS